MFLISPNLLRFLVLGRSATREATRIANLFYHILTFVLLWRVELVLKHCNVPKCYDEDYLKTFLLFSALPMMIPISGKSAHLAQECYFYQKNTNK